MSALCSVGVILTVLAALMRSQKHLPVSLSSVAIGFKRVGLHYIAFSEPAIANTRLVSLPTQKNYRIWAFRDELRLDVFTHTYVIGHLVFQVLSSRLNSILHRGLWVELPKQTPYWTEASQQIWPIEVETITWPAKYLGPHTIESFVDRWFGPTPITLITGPRIL